MTDHASVEHEPTALLVTRRPGDDRAARDGFERSGWKVETCTGPGATTCPIMRGDDCPLRSSADVAIVYVDPRGLRSGTGMIPRLRCAADRASPGIVALSGRLDPPKRGDTIATIGAARGPVAILNLVSEYLEAEVPKRGSCS